MYVISFGLIILDPLIMRMTGNRHYVRHHPQNRLQFTTINAPLGFQCSTMHIFKYMHYQVLSDLDSSKSCLMARIYTSESKPTDVNPEGSR